MKPVRRYRKGQSSVAGRGSGWPGSGTSLTPSPGGSAADEPPRSGPAARAAWTLE